MTNFLSLSLTAYWAAAAAWDALVMAFLKIQGLNSVMPGPEAAGVMTGTLSLSRDGARASIDFVSKGPMAATMPCEVSSAIAALTFSGDPSESFTMTSARLSG